MEFCHSASAISKALGKNYMNLVEETFINTIVHDRMLGLKGKKGK